MGFCDFVVKCESNRAMLPKSSSVVGGVVDWRLEGEGRIGHVAEMVDGSQMVVPLANSAFDRESWL
jgi:hypothetical protein